MDDLISRQAAIEAFRKELTTGESKGKYVTICSAVSFSGAKQILESIPSEQPERKPGRWIRDSVYTEDEPFVNPIICSECRSVATVDLYGEYNQSRYCPNCGAKMEVEK